jgi:hypothetical protein
LALDLISDRPEDVLFGQTLKRPLAPDQLAEVLKHGRQSLEDDRFQEFVHKDILDQSNFLSLSLV